MSDDEQRDKPEKTEWQKLTRLFTEITGLGQNQRRYRSPKQRLARPTMPRSMPRPPGWLSRRPADLRPMSPFQPFAFWRPHSLRSRVKEVRFRHLYDAPLCEVIRMPQRLESIPTDPPETDANN